MSMMTWQLEQNYTNNESSISFNVTETWIHNIFLKTKTATPHPTPKIIPTTNKVATWQAQGVTHIRGKLFSFTT